MAKKVARVERRLVGPHGPGKALPPATTGGETFLDREAFGVPRYVLIAVAVVFALVFIPLGVGKTLGDYANRAEEWFSPSGDSSPLFAEYEGRSPLAPSVVVGPEGLSGNPSEKLRLLEHKLRGVKDPSGGWAWFPTVIDDGKAGGGESPRLLVSLDQRLTQRSERKHAALETIRQVAHQECGVPITAIRLGGAPSVEASLDDDGKRSAATLAGLAAALGSALAYLGLRSVTLTAMAVTTAALGAATSLSLVYWLGGFVTMLLGPAGAGLGRPDALLLVTPPVVFAAALAGALRLLKDYVEERIAGGAHGAVERAAQAAFAPSLVGTVVTAAGIGLLALSPFPPVQRFGVFTALGLLVAQVLLYAIAPVLLHRFPPRLRAPQAARPIALFASGRRGFLAALCLGLAAGVVGVAFNLPSSLSAAASGLALAPIGWGLVLAAGFAAGHAVEGAFRSVALFRRGVADGRDRRSSALAARDRRLATTIPSALLVGVGLAVMVLSPFTPMQQLGLLAIPFLSFAAVGELWLLPAVLGGAPRKSVAIPTLKVRTAPAAEAEGPLTAAPPKPALVGEPAEAPAAVGPTLHRIEEPLSPANAALRSKLQRFRRGAPSERRG